MKLGGYSPEFNFATVEEVFEEMAKLGFSQVQYDFITSHSDEMPKTITDKELYRIKQASQDYGIQILAINGTFNMADSSKAYRDEYSKRFENIAIACNALDCGIITLCTGSRSSESMWRYHPDNVSQEAWDDMIQTTQSILPYAEKHHVTLGVETEASNVVFSIERTRKYLDEINNPHLKVIMDCANLFPAGTAKRENVQATIQHAFDVLGKDIVLAHGKDICESKGSGIPDPIVFASPGKGIVDYDFYFSLLKKINYANGLILHGIHHAEEFKPSIRAMQKSLIVAGY